MDIEKIKNVKYLYAKGVENENTDFITGEIQNKLSQFAKSFNEQGGTLYISVVELSDLLPQYAAYIRNFVNIVPVLYREQSIAHTCRSLTCASKISILPPHHNH